MVDRSVGATLIREKCVWMQCRSVEKCADAVVISGKVCGCSRFQWESVCMQ